MDREFIVVFVTCPDEAAARAVAAAVLEPKLAACVNIVSGVRSLYWWDGAIQDAAELLCIMKTHVGKFEALRAIVAETHPYDVPEIIALNITQGHKPYLDWINDCVS